MKTLIIYPFLCSFLLLTSCNSKQKQLKEANARLQEIKILIEENNLNSAKEAIDSIHILYPNLIEVRKKAAEYEDELKREESTNMLMQIDSVLPLKQKELDSLKQFFVFEKDEKILTVGIYTHKLQLAENNLQRNYLKANVSEKGELFLNSTYFNRQPLDCSSIKLTANNALIKETIHGSGADFYRQVFEENGYIKEVVTFNQSAENGICKFITENKDLPIKVALQGKSMYSYQLAANDKKAIADTYRLFLILNDIIKLNQQTRKAKYILNQ